MQNKNETQGHVRSCLIDAEVYTIVIDILHLVSMKLYTVTTTSHIPFHNDDGDNGIFICR